MLHTCVEAFPDPSSPKFDPLVPTSHAPVSRRAVLRSGFLVRCILWSLSLWYFLYERNCWKVGMVLDLCTFNLDMHYETSLIQGRSSRDVRPSLLGSLPSLVCLRLSIVTPNDLPTVMVDSPSTAKFLTPEEKEYVMWRKSEMSRCSWVHDS